MPDCRNRAAKVSRKPLPNTTELYYDWEGDDPDIFERDLEKYIDWYNNVRIKRRLDGSSPVEYRLSRAA